jgi:hypothetical protein
MLEKVKGEKVSLKTVLNILTRQVTHLVHSSFLEVWTSSGKHTGKSESISVHNQPLQKSCEHRVLFGFT